MNHSNEQSTPSDEILVAYLDNELDRDQREAVDDLIVSNTVVAARLEQFRRGGLPFRDAFDSMLMDAPTDRLQAILNSLPSHTTAHSGMSRRGFLATAASFIVAGVVADRLFMTWHDAESEEGWRASVADYMALYTPETLENLSQDPQSHIAQLTSVGAQLGLTLDPRIVALPGAEFRRAQILDYERMLIGQLTYLDPRHGPLALCITASKEGAVKLSSEERMGLNVVYWSSNQHAFMMIGHNPFEDLQIMARSVQLTLPA
jgi:anti-sigma factor RsiW